jgi:acyl carrier protein
VLLLDDALRPVAAGEVGEIHVLGPRLAEGYLGQEALTAERFVRSPLARRMGERLYKTGDLGRLLPDGILVFVGRADHRVKIRGQRFELGEVEAAIKRHPKVRDAAVVGRTDQYDETRLLAYFVARSEDVPSAEDLRLLLPDAAIPATFAAMAVLPRTASGKLDRRALPEPEPRSSGWTGDDEMPRTPVERELAAIWAAVLGVGHIGVNDSFFDLGGHSLNASQVIGRVSQRLGVTLSLHAFFDAPTLSSCAAVIQRLGHGADIEGNPRLSDGTLGGLTKR